MTIRSIFRWVKWFSTVIFTPAVCKGDVYANITPTGLLFASLSPGGNVLANISPSGTPFVALSPTGSIWSNLTPSGEVSADELG